MSIKYNPTPNKYSPNLPEKLTLNQYSKINKSLQFYPNPKNPMKVVWENEKEIFIFLIIGCIIFPILPVVILTILINGGIGSIKNCYKAAESQNSLTKKYYDLIYNTKSYEEYSQLYEEEFSAYLNRRFY